MWVVVVAVCLMGQDAVYCTQLEDRRYEIGQTQCVARAKDFITEIKPLYNTLKPVYIYKCRYDGERT